MGLLEDLNTGKYNLILFVIIFLLFFHQYFSNRTKESMADLTEAQMADVISKYYLADVEAVRRLSKIATQLLDGGVTIPGNLKTGKLNVDDTVIFSDNINDPNGKMKISRQGIMFGGPNNARELNSAQITAGLHVPDSLNIVGMSSDKNYGSRRIDMWAEGGLNIFGSVNALSGILKVGNTMLNEDTLKKLLALLNGK